jgi:hypothetical protein
MDIHFDHAVWGFRISVRAASTCKEREQTVAGKGHVTNVHGVARGETTDRGGQPVDYCRYVSVATDFGNSRGWPTRVRLLGASAEQSQHNPCGNPVVILRSASERCSVVVRVHHTNLKIP